MQWIHRHFSLLNMICFQLAWLVAIAFRDWSALLLAALLLAHFWLSPSRTQDLFKLITVAPLGCAFDWTMQQLAVIEFNDEYGHLSFLPPVLTPFIPVWLLMLWCHFAILLNHGLAWMQRLANPIVAIAGGIFGPLSYFAGANMGAAYLPSLPIFCFAYGAFWLLFFLPALKIQRKKSP